MVHGGFRLVLGVPQGRWMVYNGKCHENMDDDWEYPYDRMETPIDWK